MMDIPLYEKIYIDLFNQIKTGQLKSNDRLPSEKELATQYQVSRITSKKALEKLAQIGLIERIRGKGSFVSTSLPDFADLEQPINQDQSDETNEEPNGLIGLILPDFFSEWYGKKLLHTIEKRSSEMKYNLIIKLTYGYQHEEEQAILSLLQQGVEGIIVFPVSGQHYTVNLLKLVLDGFPLVLIDRHLKGIPACAVLTDNKAAGQEITEYLLNKGHKDIAFISPPEEYTTSIEERIQGYTAAYVQRRMGINSNYVVTELFSTLTSCQQLDEIEEDEIKLKQFIQENPQVTAFVACEYEIAVVLAHVLRSLGKQIPDDYSIVCFDHPDHIYNDYMFTHIKQDEITIGLKAVDLLMEQIKDNSVAVKNIIEYSLVEGSTTAKFISEKLNN
jgi:GntR family transcriptional regulator, arabinose operon transcriptional repressor